ncbi:hypothetical protein [Streptomyces sp. NRRL S-31]|uniref:hypothetical protein n=1 Tax=Streptomyces sp. NRRL S-31 TaxID=1463898 RepID=UPI00131E6940|nr:hypothetical protein [Streptomyces sp. NRRL S-31]
MVKHFKAKAALITGAALFGSLSFAGSAVAIDGSVTAVYKGGPAAEALSYGANGAVKVCDIRADGYAVATEYQRANGTWGRLENHNGNGTCKSTSNIESNPIIWYNACVMDSGDHCTAYVRGW